MAGAAQQPNQSDNSAGILWSIAAIFSMIAIVWYIYKSKLVSLYFYIKLLEISLLSHFTNSLVDVRTVILSTDPAKINFQDVVKIGNAVGDYLRYPCILVIFILAVTVYLTNSVRIFKRIYSMRDLVVVEQKNWPQVSPVANLDLIKMDIDKGPWAMAMTPMQFCKRHKLLEEFKRVPVEGMLRREMNRVEVRLKRGQANKIFIMQLGPLWMGANKLPMHSKALFAAFAARANHDSEAAAVILKQLSASATTKLDFTGVEELLKKYEKTKSVQRVLECHAYVLTVMAGMLAAARVDGVQASADFLWLKPIDRRLWYMLNTVGRQTPFTEVAGVFAHWVAEREMGKKLVIPMVDEATNALELALKDIIYKTDEEEV